MNSDWIDDYEMTSKNGHTGEWPVSPLEYAWGNGIFATKWGGRANG